jgi:hypothetical protein
LKPLDKDVEAQADALKKASKQLQVKPAVENVNEQQKAKEEEEIVSYCLK